MDSYINRNSHLFGRHFSTLDSRLGIRLFLADYLLVIYSRNCVWPLWLADLRYVNQHRTCFSIEPSGHQARHTGYWNTGTRRPLEPEYLACYRRYHRPEYHCHVGDHTFLANHHIICNYDWCYGADILSLNEECPSSFERG